MKARVLLTTAAAVRWLSLVSGGCGVGGDAATGKITEEAASATGKALRQRHQQDR